MVDDLAVQVEFGLDDVERGLRRVVGDRPAGSHQIGFGTARPAGVDIVSRRARCLGVCFACCDAEAGDGRASGGASPDVPSDLQWARGALENRLVCGVSSRPGSYSWTAAA